MGTLEKLRNVKVRAAARVRAAVMCERCALGRACVTSLLLLLPDVVERRLVGFVEILQMHLSHIFCHSRNPISTVVRPELSVDYIDYGLLRVMSAQV
jgi:hypothetical protein